MDLDNDLENNNLDLYFLMWFVFLVNYFLIYKS